MLEEGEYQEEWGVFLDLDPDTRVWDLRARGNAAMLLFILMDVSPVSLISKLIDESKFDAAVKGFEFEGE
jgi:hypothetical protein|tara:strand:+ start:7124 stop:7333 length:210 start_codon:yes stop_codon:yes gene_type:complete